MTEYTTGAGQKILVHSSDECRGGYCTIHNPSMTWPTEWRSGWGGFMEYTCKCGVGYPAPEDKGAEGHVFGCCGNPECLREYREACDKVRKEGEEDD
jgi:hypothetical protein